MKKLFISLIFLLLYSSQSFGAVYNFTPDDTKLDASNPTGNYKTSADVTIIGNSSYIQKYDLSSIAGQEVISAHLWLYEYSRGGNHPVTFYRMVRDFVPSEARYDRPAIGQLWGTTGALNSTTDYTITDSVSYAQNLNPGWFTVDVKPMVDAARLSGSNTLGIMFKSPTGNSYDSLRTAESASNKPYLVIATGTPGVQQKWYVRPDGGSCGVNKQCTGNTNAPYPGTGINQACACNHFNWISGTATGTKAETFMGGDSIYIAGPTYTVGQSNGNCTTDCTPNPFQGGATENQPTQIYGEGYDTGCTTPPLVLGKNNSTVFKVTSNTTVRCLELKSANGCQTNLGVAARGKIDNDPTQDNIICSSGDLYGRIGLSAGYNASGLIFENVKVSGMARFGFEGYALGKMSMYNFQLIGNQLNWQGDPGTCDGAVKGPECHYTGPFYASKLKIKWSGCTMRYKDTPGGLAAGTAHDCMGQGQGGYAYGDGFGINGMSGKWTIVDSEIENNDQDGLDMLYDGTYEKIVNRSFFQGNNGASFKTSSPNVTIQDSFLLGDCGHWRYNPAQHGSPNRPGASGTNCNHDAVCDANENYSACSDCRAPLFCRAQNGVVIGLGNSTRPANVTIINNTMTDAHDINLAFGGTMCLNDSVTIKNNLFYGTQVARGGVTTPANWFYQSDNRCDSCCYLGHVFNVSGVVTPPSRGDTYSSSNGFVYTVQAVELSGGAGKIRTTEPHYNDPPASGTITRISGFGDNTMAYSSVVNGSHGNNGCPCQTPSPVGCNSGEGNCSCGDNGCPYFSNSVNLHQDNNIIWNTPKGSLDKKGVHDRYIDPGFVGPIYTTEASPYIPPATGDRSPYYANFALSPTSPARAVNAGTDAADPSVVGVGLNHDAYNNPRGNAPDTGASMFNSTQSCVANAGTCYTDSDCCSTICNLGNCIASPLIDGNSCSSNWACSSLNCTNNVCGGASACSLDNGTCSTDYQCCGNHCCYGACSSSTCSSLPTSSYGNITLFGSLGG